MRFFCRTVFANFIMMTSLVIRRLELTKIVIQMKTIKKEIAISAPKEKVWAILMDDNYNRDWYSIFSPGTYAKTDWIEGHKVRFIDETENGMLGRITSKKPYEYMSIVYDGIVSDGNDDEESPMAVAMKGAQEIYELKDNNGVTTLSISADMDDEYYEEMSDSWEKALQRILELTIAMANNPALNHNAEPEANI